ncbi:hypothetical protein [Limnohabitans sp. TS-CS-82]|uniref:hypothetical protein n=1 Tax=Limnohabitans sp. TS-CS-82 TaxID=2094193 RepID=UPI0011B07F1C|nr:hypothetical protein [Limnohabitans sp. TS-CS-82]
MDLVLAIKRQGIRLLACAVMCLLVLNGVAGNWLMSLGISQQVYLRDLMFSEIVSDHQRINVNEWLARGFKRDKQTDLYAGYVHPNSLEMLEKLPKDSDRALALAIVDVIGHADGSVCGLETLGATVFDTRRGKGCCSDYSKSWLFYANYLGLTAREVSLFNHTTVEYWDRQSGRWQWLDPYNRAEMVDAQGQAMSLLSVRNADFGSGVSIKLLPLADAKFDPDQYAGYSRTQMGTMLWRRGTNFLEVEAWDRRLQAWGLPKKVRQLVTLVSGVQPGWLMLTTHADHFYYKLLRSLLWLVGVVWASLNVLLFVCMWQCQKNGMRNP